MTFAREQDVRAQALLQDFESVTSEQIEECLEQAHAEVLQQTTLQEETAATADVIHAEAQLALSILFHRMAVSKALDAKQIRVAGLHVDAHQQTEQLRDFADTLWLEAWSALRNMLKTPHPPALVRVEGSRVTR